MPGLVVTQHSGDGKANQYFLRGFNLDHGTDFATSVDGIPVNLPTNAHGQGLHGREFHDPGAGRQHRVQEREPIIPIMGTLPRPAPRTFAIAAASMRRLSRCRVARTATTGQCSQRRPRLGVVTC